MTDTNEKSLTTDASDSFDKRFEALHALYNNKQQWVRHYESLLARVTPISTTVSLGLAAFVSENTVSSNTTYIILTVPFVLICFTIWFNSWCDDEIRRQFKQIVAAEKGMGFYNIVAERQEVLPSRYLNSPARTRPIIYAGYALQFVAFAVLSFVVADQLF